MRLFYVITAVLLLGLAVQSGCSCPMHKSAPAGTQVDPAPQAAAVVRMTDQYTFDPAKVTVHVGDTVEWKNASQAAHTVTCDPSKAGAAENVSLPKGAKPFNSGNIGPGKTFSHTFTVPGLYKYVCIPHEMMAMTGQVDVQEAAAK